MELSERWIQKFEAEGFTDVSERQDAPGAVCAPQVCNHKTSLFVTDGSITFDFEGEKREVKAGERFDVPTGKAYTTVAGPGGMIAIVGESDE